MSITYDDSGANVPAGTPADDIAAALAVALAYDPPSRWVIGDLLVGMRSQYGADAMQAAIPEDAKASRLARLCLQVSERWPAPMRDADLEWGHYKRCRWLDDDAADLALVKASDEGWSPAQLGKWLAGLDPDEPAIAEMLQDMANRGADRVELESTMNAEWRVVAPVVGPPQESYTAAIKAAYRQHFGAKAEAAA
jgi:hypothetical protein